jgi:cyclic pyranopterin phosphate synthase
MTELTHFDEDGSARMVDVGAKPETQRVAKASAVVSMNPATMGLIQNREIQKGDVLELARVAGIMGSKRTADLIPLCHPLRIDAVQISFEVISDTEIRIQSTVSATDRTGVEMEALVAASVAGMTIYDMCKSVDRGMKISDVQLDEKSGGKSGKYVREISN